MKVMNRVLDAILYLGMIPILLVGAYALWDNVVVTRSAEVDKELLELAIADSDELFERIDSRYVIGWLTIDGTNINYPVVQ